MNCEDALCLISGHIDGQNTAEEEALLQAHLENCASCREILQAYQAVDQGVAALEEEPPQGLAEAVMEQILQHPSQRSHRRRLFLGSGTAVAAVAAVLALLLFTGRLPNLNQSRASTVHPADDAAAGLQTEGIQEASPEAGASDAVPKASRAQAQPEDAARRPPPPGRLRRLCSGKQRHRPGWRSRFPHDGYRFPGEGGQYAAAGSDG